MSECRICGRKAHDAFACATCAQTARDDLKLIADLASHLDGKRARERSNWTTGTIGRTAVPPLPYDPRVTAVANPIRIALHGTASIVGYTASAPPDDTITGVAHWLVGYCEWLRRQDVGPEEFGSFERAKNALVELFDNPPSQLYIGRCGGENKCPASLYVEADEANKPAAASVTCPTCLRIHEVGERQLILKAGVSDYLGTSHEISALCRHMLGDDVSTAMIRGYAHRGTIAAKGTRNIETNTGPREADLYCIGDVMDAAESARRNSEEMRAVRRDVRHTAQQSA